jgi:hypothetical protein
MLPFQIIYLWVPQIIGFGCFLFMFMLMLRAWRRTGNNGFLMLAIIAAVGEIQFLTLKFGGWLFPALGTIIRAANHAWISSLLGLAGVAAWWLLNKQLTAKGNDGGLG